MKLTKKLHSKNKRLRCKTNKSGGGEKSKKNKPAHPPIVAQFKTHFGNTIPKNLQQSHELVITQSKGRQRSPKFPQHTIEYTNYDKDVLAKFTPDKLKEMNQNYIEKVKQYEQSKSILSRVRKALTPSDLSKDVWRSMLGMKPKDRSGIKSNPWGPWMHEN
jgi:hypothetical protein